MTRKLYEEPSVKSIADGIRRINGSNRKYKIGEMSKHIRSWAPKKITFTQDSVSSYRIDLTNFNGTELITAKHMFQNLQIATQSIRQIFCKENKIKTAEGMFDMSFNSSSYKLFVLEDTNDNIYYMPENETVERMFYKSSLTGFNYIFKAPKLMNLKEMFRSSEVYSVVLKFADWGLPKGYDCSYILADLQHLAQTEFGTEGKTYPGNVEGMFKLSTITGKPYIDLSTFDFSMCNNFKGMFEGVSGYVQQIAFLNETVVLPDGASFDSMFCNFRAGLKDFSFLRWLRVEHPDMRLMFLYVRDVDRIDIRGFNLANATNLNGLIDCSLNPNCTIYVGTEADEIALRNSSSTPELLKIIVVGR